MGLNKRALGLQSALALLTLAFVSSVACLFTRAYLVNDDVGIIGFITGGYVVPYEGAILTGALHLLYSIAPGIAWFAWTLYAALSLSLYLSLLLVWRVCQRRWTAMLCTLVVLGCYLQFILFLDFTAVASLLCMTAVMWAGIQVLEGQDIGLPMLGPGIVFALGMLLRPDCLWGALAYLLPFIVAVALTYISHGASWPAAKRAVGMAALFLLPMLIAASADITWRHIQMTPQEARYESFNAAGGAFDHLSPGRRREAWHDRATLASMGWGSREFNDLNNWNFLDERIYTPDAMTRLASAAPLLVPDPETLKDSFLARFSPSDPLSLLLVAAWPLAVLSFLSGRRVMGIIIFLSPLYCIALTLWMYLQYAYHARIEVPFLIGAALANLLLAISVANGTGVARRWWTASMVLGLVMAAIAAWSISWQVLQNQPKAAQRAERLSARLAQLDHDFSGAVILIQPSKLPLEWLDPLKPIPLDFHPINGGWNIFSPRFYDQMGVLGVQHGYDLVGAMVDRPGVYVLSTQEWCSSLSSDVETVPGMYCQAVGDNVYSLRSGR